MTSKNQYDRNWNLGNKIWKKPFSSIYCYCMKSQICVFILLIICYLIIFSSTPFWVVGYWVNTYPQGIVASKPTIISTKGTSFNSLKHCTARKVSVFGIFLARFHFECGNKRTRKTPNTDTFHAVFTMIIGWWSTRISWIYVLFSWICF